MAEKQIADRHWHTWARVRILERYSAGNGGPHYDVRVFEPGEELRMIQWGIAGREIDRDSWWTSTDIDGAFIISADKVEVLEILTEVAP